MLVLPSPTSLVLAWVRPRLSWRWGRSRAFGPLQGWHRGLQTWTRGPWCRDPRASGLIGESRSSPRWQSQARDGRPWTCGCFKGGQVGGEREMPAGARLRGAQQMCKENMKKKNTTELKILSVGDSQARRFSQSIIKQFLSCSVPKYTFFRFHYYRI